MDEHALINPDKSEGAACEALGPVYAMNVFIYQTE